MKYDTLSLPISILTYSMFAKHKIGSLKLTNYICLCLIDLIELLFTLVHTSKQRNIMLPHSQPPTLNDYWRQRI